MMFLGLFKRKVKVVTVKRKSKLKPKKSKTGRKALPKKRKRPLSKKVKKTKAKTVRKVKPKVSAKSKMPQIVGRITHYFPHVRAGVILVTDKNIGLGDTLHIKGHTTDFKQKVSSMQINNVSIKQAKPGDEIGLLVKSRVRHNDIVYKL